MANDEQVVDAAMDAILEYEKQDVPRISETEFKRTILPMIASIHKVEEPDMTLWLQIAGSWRRPIDFVSDTSDDVIFRVPPLVGSNDLPYQQSGRNSTFDIIRNAQRKMQVTARAGDEALKRGLEGRIKPKGDIEENTRQWQFIRRRYNLDETNVDESTPESSSEVKSKPTNGPEIEGYDDL